MVDHTIWGGVGSLKTIYAPDKISEGGIKSNTPCYPEGVGGLKIGGADLFAQHKIASQEKHKQ